MAISKSLAVGTILTVALVCLAQEQETQAKLKDLDWLIGTWQRQTSRGTLYEEWQKVSGNTFEGSSYTLQAGDTTFVEFLRLEQFGTEIFYVPKVPHNLYPVPFKLVKATKNSFTFANPEHDFPQRIIYRYLEAGKMQARIEGKQGGKETGVDFNFVRLK